MHSSEWQRKAAIPEKGLATCKIKQEAITDNMISHLRSYFRHRISEIKIAEFIVPHSHFKSSFEILHYFFSLHWIGVTFHKGWTNIQSTTIKMSNLSFMKGIIHGLLTIF